MSKIAFIGDKFSPQALLAQIAEREGMDGFVAAVRVDGCWYTCWTTDVDCASLSMAALKMLADVQAHMHGEELTWSPPQDESA